MSRTIRFGVGLLAVLLMSTIAMAPASAMVSPDDMVSGTVSASSSPGFPFTTTLYTVPAGMNFVLTDFHYAYILITSTITTHTQLTLRENTTDRWMSRVFQSVSPAVVNWPLIQDFTTGLVFGEGSQVVLHQVIGGNNNTTWTASWSGYLVPIGSASIEDESTPGIGLALDSKPNPSDDSMTLTFQITDPMEITLAVFDVQGRQIRTLHEGPIDAGFHAFKWNGKTDQGQDVRDGVYFARLLTEDGAAVGKITRQIR